MNQSNQPTPPPVDAWDDPRVTAYVFNELSSDERVEFETALQQSDALQQAVEEARAVADQLGVHFQTDAVAALSNESREAIRQTTQVNPARENVSDGRRSGRRWIQIAVAAGIAFVAVGLIWPASRAAREMSQATAQPGFNARLIESTEGPVSMREFDAMALPSDTVSNPPTLRYQAEVDTLDLSVLPEEASSEGMTVGKPTSPSGMALQSDQMDVAMVPTSEPDEVAQSDFVRTDKAKNGQMLDRHKLELSRRRIERSQLLEASPLSSAPAVRLNVAAAEEEMEALVEMPAPAMPAPAMPAPGQASSAPHAAPFAGAAVAENQAVLSKDPTVRRPRSRSADMEMGMGMGMGMEGMGMGMEMEMEMEMGIGGMGPGMAGDRYEPIEENDFQRVSEHQLSTFSIDVDTASYSKVRASLLQQNRLPRPAAVRIEELINYFDYQYDAPEEDAEHPFAANMALASCPWNTDHRLLRVGIQAKSFAEEERPQCNLVFLIDTSGSMQSANKLPLVIDGMKELTKNLSPDDRVAIVVYAGAAGLVLESTPASKRKRIDRALTQLKAGGSTNGGQGIQLAYEVARSHFIKDGVNRVILCSDGDFNVGVTGTDQLVELARNNAKSGVDLTVLGFGMGNHNDAMMERVSNDAEGNYAYVDSIFEARKVLVDQLQGTLVTVAKDVKIQIEFNPQVVGAYRLIGYENRLLAKEDFKDDTVDAGEIGAGHRVTALYELVPAGQEPESIAPAVDPLRYGPKPVEHVVEEDVDEAISKESLTLKIRYKPPQGKKSTEILFPLVDSGEAFEATDPEMRFAAAVAGFGMKLRGSQHAGDWTLKDVQRVAVETLGEDSHGLRQEFVLMVMRAMRLGPGR